jgi:hypothetical protein
LFLTAILAYFALNGANSISNLPPQLTKQQELSQLPVFFEESNTISVVCPIEAKNNPNYPDPACKNTSYFGYVGISGAISTGGKNHTVYIKNGNYPGFASIKVYDQNRTLTIAGESRDGVVIYKVNYHDDWRRQPIFVLKGDQGITIENLTLTAPEELVELPKYKTVGIEIGENTAATIKNLVVTKNFFGVYILGDTQGISLYQNIFVQNKFGVFSTTHFDLSAMNNIFAYNTGYAAVFAFYKHYDNWEPFKNNTGDLATKYRLKTVTNNTFYNNNVALVSAIPTKTDIVNNLFSKNVSRDIEIPEYFVESLSSPYTRTKLQFNFTDNDIGKFCTYQKKELTKDYFVCSGFIDNPNIANIQPEPFIKVDLEKGEFNFRLSQSSNLIDKGDPSYIDRDKTRSDPGAYGGYCYYDFDGCGGLEFPILSNIPVINSDGEVAFDPSILDNNNDGKVDIKDVIFLLKYLFQ